MRVEFSGFHSLKWLGGELERTKKRAGVLAGNFQTYVFFIL